MEEKKLDLRRIWVVFTLLDGTKKSQQDIIEEVEDIDKRITNLNENKMYELYNALKEDYKDKAEEQRSRIGKMLEKVEKIKGDALIEIKKTSTTKIFEYLEQEGIIKREDAPIENSNLTKKICWIPDDFNSLEKINKLVYNSRIDPLRKTFFAHYFTSTKLGKKLLLEFVPKVSELVNDFKPPLNKEELEIVDNLIMISPVCLNYVLGTIGEKRGYLRDKRFYLFQLQATFAFDIMNPESLHSPTNVKKQIMYKTSMSFKKIDYDYEKALPILNINVGLENGELQTELKYFPPSKNLPIDFYIGAYLSSYKLHEMASNIKNA